MRTTKRFSVNTDQVARSTDCKSAVNSVQVRLLLHGPNYREVVFNGTARVLWAHLEGVRISPSRPKNMVVVAQLANARGCGPLTISCVGSNPTDHPKGK